jgi:hypothetical protein
LEYAGCFLIALCGLFTIVTFGWGLLLFPAMLPVFHRFGKAAKVPPNPYRQGQPWRSGQILTGAASALAIFVSALIAFAAVFAGTMTPVWLVFGGSDRPLPFLVYFFAGLIAGLTAACAVAYFVTGVLFPLPRSVRGEIDRRPT